ncbi:MAG TPA: response regulator transcription factor [Candidatus Saccharimonadales bacterium]|nr:response regulator transcription factor [Candidatus Saccharimonadales bacterium]
MNRLLLIDDDKSLCALLTERLQAERFHLDVAHDGETGLERAISANHSLVILDVMLPAMGGMEVLRSVRAKSNIPVLMLTARGDDIDRIMGLEFGADDYLPKPFHPRELVARIRAILRRFDERRPEAQSLTAGDITIDVGVREACVGHHPLRLTTIEFEMLEAFVRHAGRPLSREFLSHAAMGRDLGLFDRAVDVHVSNLRRKLEAVGGTERIKTVHGAGYLLTQRRVAKRIPA